jgi:RnfABCDGE-type electron transport complex D subunit
MSLLDKIAGMVDGPKRGLEKVAEKVFGKLGPVFEKGRPLHFIHPAYEAIENFLLWPSTRTDIAPHVRDPQDVKRFMSMVMLCVMPCIAASIYFFGWRIVPMIVVTYASGLIVEWIFAIIRKEGINEGFFVTGLLYPLILPPATPLWMVSLGIVFGVVVGKEVFGGTGRNLFNPALVGRCFLAIAYPVQLTAGWIAPVTAWPGRLGQYLDASSVDAMTKATPLGLAKAGELTGTMDLLLGGTSGCAGETSAVLIIGAGLLLLATRIISWRTVFGMLGTVAIFSGILHAVDADTFAPAGFHMLAGGLLFGAIFMATDPVTSPITRHGRLAYGILIGVITVLIRSLTGYDEGVMFAILLGNIFAPVLDEVFIRLHMRRLSCER